MEFELDDTMQAVVQTAAAVLGDAGMDADGVWRALGQSGLLLLSVPARLGGEELGVLASMVVLTEVGRRGLAVPALATLALGVLPVVRWGTSDQQEELLDGWAERARAGCCAPVLTAAIREPSSPQPATPATTCTADLAVTGTKVGVAYAELAGQLGLKDVRYVPVSALRGDNIVHESDAMPWYQGEPLLPLLEELPVEEAAPEDDAALRFPVQLVIRQDGSQSDDFRGYAGRVEAGTVRVGQKLRVFQ